MTTVHADSSGLETRADLLEHYATRPPKRFVQIDGFLNHGHCDAMAGDEDGDAICKLATRELMHGAPVRVFIEPGTRTDDAVRLLSKMRDSVKSSGREVVHWGNPDGQPSENLADLLLRAWQSGTLPPFEEINSAPPETLDDYDRQILSRIRKELDAPF